jgi:hypothetical protein
MKVLVVAVLALGACSSPAPRLALTEGYCPDALAARCFFDQPPNDGF